VSLTSSANLRQSSLTGASTSARSMCSVLRDKLLIGLKINAKTNPNAMKPRNSTMLSPTSASLTLHALRVSSSERNITDANHLSLVPMASWIRRLIHAKSAQPVRS